MRPLDATLRCFPPVFGSELATGRHGVSGTVSILSHAWACLQRYPVLTGKTETKMCLHRPNRELEHALILVSFLIFFFELTVIAPTDDINFFLNF